MGTPRKGDLYWVKVDQRETRGSEQHGRRPFVVVSSNAINSALPLVIAVPLSTKLNKKNRQHRIYIPKNEMILEEAVNLQDSIALTEQLRALSTDRLESRAGRLTPTAIAAVEAGIQYVLALP